MLVKKALPENGELVLVKISKIMPHGAYCRLVEYEVDAYLPIAEVSSGWIKNIHEFIKEGAQEVAKVIFVDSVKRAVDVSLKKASAKEKKDKVSEYSMEKRSEGIFNKALVATKKEAKKEELLEFVVKKVQSYTTLVNDIYEGKDPLADLPDKEFKQALYDIVSKSIKPKTYTVSYNVELTLSDPRGSVETIRTVFNDVEKLGVEVLYLGAPHYKLISTDSSYPKAEDRIKEANKIFEKHKGIEYNLVNKTQ